MEGKNGKAMEDLLRSIAARIQQRRRPPTRHQTPHPALCVPSNKFVNPPATVPHLSVEHFFPSSRVSYNEPVFTERSCVEVAGGAKLHAGSGQTTSMLPLEAFHSTPNSRPVDCCAERAASGGQSCREIARGEYEANCGHRRLTKESPLSKESTKFQMQRHTKTVSCCVFHNYLEIADPNSAAAISANIRKFASLSTDERNARVLYHQEAAAWSCCRGKFLANGSGSICSHVRGVSAQSNDVFDAYNEPKNFNEQKQLISTTEDGSSPYEGSSDKRMEAQFCQMESKNHKTKHSLNAEASKSVCNKLSIQTEVIGRFSARADCHLQRAVLPATTTNVSGPNIPCVEVVATPSSKFQSNETSERCAGAPDIVAALERTSPSQASSASLSSDASPAAKQINNCKIAIDESGAMPYGALSAHVVQFSESDELSSTATSAASLETKQPIITIATPGESAESPDIKIWSPATNANKNANKKAIKLQQQTSTLQPENTVLKDLPKHSLMQCALLDCYGRFMVNLPVKMLNDPMHLFFQIQEAHWWYEDFWHDQFPKKLPKLTFTQFGSTLARECSMLGRYLPTESFIPLLHKWRKYCRAIPLRGAIIVNKTLTQCLMVQGWHGGELTFPKGKVDEGETDVVCACREVWEEVGLDISALIDENVYVDATVAGQHTKYFVVVGIDEATTRFAPQKRKEIRQISWVPLRSLSGWFYHRSSDTRPTLCRGNLQTKQPLYERSVTPFVKGLRNFVELFKGKR